MRRIAILGMVSVFLLGVAMAKADDPASIDRNGDSFRYRLKCQFMEERGKEKKEQGREEACFARARIFQKKYDPPTPADTEKDNENRLEVVCNDVPIYRDGAKLVHVLGGDAIVGIDGHVPAIALPLDALIPHEGVVVKFASLNLGHEQIPGYCEIERKKLRE